MSPPFLPLARYRLRFSATEPVRLPEYAGSAWRSALGHALKRSVCTTSVRECRQCLLYRACPYPYIFETPPPPDAAKMRKYSAAPHPFVLETAACSGALAVGDTIELGLVLVARANAYLGYLLLALERAGLDGIGKGRGKLALVEVLQETVPGSGRWTRVYAPGGIVQGLPPAHAEPPPMPNVLRIRIGTPLRLRRDGRLVRAEDMRFSDLFSSLLRRISLLSSFHTDTPLETDFRGLSHAARGVAFRRASLSWRDWTRYSSRQGTHMKLGGIVGEMLLASEDLAPFWSYLWIGQYVHAGHGTSMGLGRYRIDPASLQDERPEPGSATIAS